MKVLLVSAHSAISGANKSMCVLAEHLTKKGVDVTIALRKDGDIVEEIVSRNLKYVVLRNYTWTKPINKRMSRVDYKKYIGNILTTKAIKKYLAREGFDIVHNNSISSFVIAKCANSLGIKTIWHFREFLEEDHGLTISRLYDHKRIINKADYGIAISRSILRKYESIYSIPIRMIYNGIASEEFLTEREILKENTIEIAVIGRVCEGKNQLEVVQALSLIDGQSNNKFKLHIIGDKEEHSTYYKTLVEQIDSKLNCNVSFDGIITNITEAYKNIDVVIVPSKAEAFGRVAVEAMLSGCYVIGADTAGTSEILDDRFSVKYSLGDVDALAQEIINIDRNRDIIKQRAKEGQKYALSKFSSVANADKIYELYCEVLSKKD